MKKLLLGFLLVIAPSVSAQTTADTTHARAQRARLDSISVPMAALRRWCNVKSYKYPVYLRTTCSIALGLPDASARAAEDSLLIPPPPVTNQKPVASFTVSGTGTIRTFDASASTDDHGIASYTWRSDPVRPSKTGVIMTRTLDPSDTGWTEWLTVKDSAGLADSTSRQVTVTPPAVDTITPPPVDTITPPPPPSSTVVELPRVLLSFLQPTPTRSINVPAGANLQTALSAAQPGDELILAAGATFTGNFTIGNCGAGWITVRSSGTIPAGRMTPTKAAPLAKLVTANTAQALRATNCKLWLSGLEVTITAAATASFPNYGLLLLEGTDQVLDRVYVHGQPTSNLIRCVTVNGARQQVSQSWISDCHANGYDSQAIHGGTGSGPFKIVDNTLEAAGENVMFGGQDPFTAGLVPSDIEIRGNHIRKPLAWQSAQWTVKNLMEFKNAVRVLVEGNVLDGSWRENGGVIIVKSSNQSGGCRWCRSTDVTIRRNLITNAGQGIAVAGSTNSDSTTKRVLIAENVLDLSQPGPRQGLILLAGAQSVSAVRNVFSGTTNSAAVVEGGAPCVFDSNVWSRGQYGVFASGVGSGTAALNKGCGTAGWTWSGMTLIGASGSGYPAGTTWVASESAAPLAAQIRSLVAAATTGVVVQP